MFSVVDVVVVVVFGAPVKTSVTHVKRSINSITHNPFLHTHTQTHMHVLLKPQRKRVGRCRRERMSAGAPEGIDAT